MSVNFPLSKTTWKQSSFVFEVNCSTLFCVTSVLEQLCNFFNFAGTEKLSTLELMFKLLPEVRHLMRCMKCECEIVKLEIDCVNASHLYQSSEHSGEEISALCPNI